MHHLFGVWCCQPEAFGIADLNSAIAKEIESQARRRERGVNTPTRDVRDGVIAVLTLSGLLTKHESFFGDGLPSGTAGLADEVVAVAKDPGIKGILLRVDSPGGMVAGTEHLAAAVRDASDRKPVVAFVEDLAASAAYWVASAANQIVASPAAVVGGIGTYSVVADLSGAAKQQGIRVHVVRAGEHKGAGVPGTKVTDTQLAEMQRIVDSVNDIFVQAVANGRGLPPARARALADGRVHIASEARALGLVDRVGTIEDALADLIQDRVPRSRPGPGALEEWDCRVEELTFGGRTKREAIAELVKVDPDLHERYLEASQPARR